MEQIEKQRDCSKTPFETQYFYFLILISFVTLGFKQRKFLMEKQLDNATDTVKIGNFVFTVLLRCILGENDWHRGHFGSGRPLPLCEIVNTDTARQAEHIFHRAN